MTESPTVLAPLLRDRYRVEERLGTTRLAVIYRAYDERVQRRVLVALFRGDLAAQESLRRRFLAEAQVGVRRLHPSLLEVYDTGDIAGRPFLVMEAVSGRTLRDVGPLTVEVALRAFRQVVGAVAACQAAGAPHPPISSANIVLVDEGLVKLVENWWMTRSEVSADLAYYRAPECVAGHPPTGTSVVYSLGLLLIEMLTGSRTGLDPQPAPQAHQDALPTLGAMHPHILMPSLARMIMRATNPDPSRRFPSVSDLLQALDEVRSVMNRDTDRLAPYPSLSAAASDRSKESSPDHRRHSVAHDSSPSDPPLSMTAQHRMQKESRRSPFVLIAMVALFVLVGSGAYLLTSLAIEGLANIRLPRPQVTLPEWITLPDWLTGVVPGSGEVLTVTIGDVEGLNLREAPGLKTRVIALLPNGTRVRKLEGPRNVDGVPWVRVRGEINGQPVEGWVSQLYVRSEG